MWTNGYIGIPFEELDCWQLCVRVYAQELGIQLPSFVSDYADANDRAALERIFSEELAKPSRWRQVESGDEGEFDLALMRLSPLPTHVGLLTGDHRILHSLPGPGAVVESRQSLRLRGNVVGYFRYDESV